MIKKYCNKCEKELTRSILTTFEIEVNGDNTDTLLCRKCFEKFTNWLDTK